MPIELVAKVHVQKNENEETWYGTYMFKDLGRGDVEDLVDEVKTATGADVGSVKGVYDFESKEWSQLLVTLKGFDDANEAQEVMEILKKTAKAHKIKVRKETTLDAKA